MPPCAGSGISQSAIQVAADLTHCLHRLCIDLLPGLNARAANFHTALGRHLQQRFGHWTAARVFDANEEDLHFDNSASDSGLQGWSY